MNRTSLLTRLLTFACLAALSTGVLVGCGGGSSDTAPSDAPAPNAVDGVGEPDWVQDVVMYEIFIPDFTQEGTFRAAIDRFDELKAMGVNTLWLMPIHPVGEKRAKTDIGPLGSPYAVRDYKGVNPDYGTEEDFQAFVDAAHERDMYVIIDWVGNHTAWDHPWVEEHPEYYTEGPVDGRFTYPLLDGDTTDWTDVVDLNFDNQEMRQKMIDAMQFWVEEYDIDGYRCDVAHQMPVDFWEPAIDSIEAIKPVLMLAEADGMEMHEAGFDLSYAWPFYGEMKRVWEENAPLSELMTQVDTTLANLPPGAKRLRFTTNHDETAWDEPPTVVFEGVEGSKAAFVLSMTLPGVPLVYNGQELGVQDTISFFEATPYDWSSAGELADWYEQHLNVYATSEALRQGDFTVHTPNADDVVIYSRAADDEEMLVVVNGREEPASIAMPSAYKEATLTDVISGETVTADPIELDAFGYHILRVSN